eukprot:CAMPEP_0206475388 /NCGR_PEP_ID=MMETSP0324_2-20121206/34043_1 /ASSEMBLY_ACC=CAM_ASM_000836 /TAXON_ID=2866 /ORGANISM="Crypthecodinium cohnii, Strain Seligo" /LENGTH=32 /DNA_ID= /DNA_START= /DNA_END= /DNA_ORIENTATION=
MSGRRCPSAGGLPPAYLLGSGLEVRLRAYSPA